MTEAEEENGLLLRGNTRVVWEEVRMPELAGQLVSIVFALPGRGCV